MLAMKALIVNAVSNDSTIEYKVSATQGLGWKFNDLTVLEASKFKVLMEVLIKESTTVNALAFALKGVTRVGWKFNDCLDLEASRVKDSTVQQ